MASSTPTPCPAVTAKHRTRKRVSAQGKPAQPDRTKTYAYDAFEQHKQDYTDSNVTTSTYNEPNQLVADPDSTHVSDDRGTINSQTTSAGTTSHTFDAFGQIRSVNAVGYDYDAYGRIIERTDTSSNQTCVDAGKVVATFRSRDTFAGDLDRPTSQNRYQYAGNNPIRYWDPTGNDYEFYGDEDLERAVDQIGLLSESAFQQLIAEATQGRATKALAILRGPGVAPAPVVEVRAVQESIVSNSTSVSDIDWGNYTLVAELIDSPIQPDGSLGESYLRTVPHHEVYRAVVESVQMTKAYQGTDGFANFLAAVTPLETMTTSCFEDLWSLSCGMSAGFTLGGPLLSNAQLARSTPVAGAARLAPSGLAGLTRNPDGLFGSNVTQLKTRTSGGFVRDAGGPVKVFQSEVPGGRSGAEQFFEAQVGRVPNAALATDVAEAGGLRYVIGSSSHGAPTVEVFDVGAATVEKIRFLE